VLITSKDPERYSIPHGVGMPALFFVVYHFLANNPWVPRQRRMQKIFMVGFHSAAYGGHFYFVCAVCDVTIERRIYVSNQRFDEVC